MPKATPLICNLNAGEISPKLSARPDISKYYNACKKLENFVPLVEGGAKRTPGTYFVIATKDSSKKSKLKSFHFSTTQAYQIEQGDLYFRFFKDEGQIVIDTSMDDFDPSQEYFIGEYTKMGYYVYINAGGGAKHIWVINPYAQGNPAISVGCVSNGIDTMTVTSAGVVITINLANATPAKNAANLIQVALRALVTVNGVDVSAWTVGEDAAYAAARPTAGINIAAVAMIGGGAPYQAATLIPASATNTTEWIGDAAHWTQRTMGNPVEIVTPYTENDVFELKGPQSADTLYIYHELYAPRKLVRHSHINWELKNLVCLDTNAKAITDITNATTAVVGCPGNKFQNNDVVIIYDVEGMVEINDLVGTAGTITLNGFNAAGINSTAFSPYKSGGYAQMAITGITQANPTVVTLPKHGFENGNRVYISHIKGMVELNDRVFTVANRTNTTFELLGENSTAHTAYTSAGKADRVLFYDAGDFPSCATFFEQRLYSSGTINNPQTTYGSVVSDYENHTEDPEADDGAIEYTIPGALNRVDRIRWMIGEDYLLLGTSGSIQRFGASSIAEPLTSTNVSVKSQIGIGVSDIEPQNAIDCILWLTRGATFIRQIIWNEAEMRYVAPNMNRLASHIAYGSTKALSGIVDMAFQKEPIPILWCIRKDGQLLGMTYEIQEQVYAWFRVVTDGYFESVSVISKDGEEDQVWVIVNRGTLAVPKRYVEFFKPHELYADILEAFFVHSGLTRTLVNETQVTIAHLANKAVDVVIGGVYIGRITANGSGVVALGGTYSGVCHVGLPFTSTVETMNLNAGSQLGTGKGKMQKVNRITMCFHETSGGKYGPTTAKLYAIPFKSTDSLKTEDVDAQFPGNWERKATLCIVQDQPYPMTVLALVPRLSLEED